MHTTGSWRQRGWSRRSMLAGMAATAGLGIGSVHSGSSLAFQGAAATPIAVPDPDEITSIVESAVTELDLRAVIYRVLVGDQEVVTGVMGESMTGQPATADMHFRNGNVAYMYMTTLMLLQSEDGLSSIDDPISNWLPDVQDADQVTLRMLANMTAGYPDYVQNETLLEELLEDPFRHYTADRLIEIGLSTPRVFEPGTNWDYSHTNYVLLGRVLEEIGGQPLDEQLRDRVLDPLGLDNTSSSLTAEMPEPVLNAFTSERRGYLGLPADQQFLEESTFWNPSWATAPGAVQSTNIFDMATTVAAIGRGDLLSEESHQEQISSALLGFGEPLEGCPSCHTLDDMYTFGLGVILSGEWIMQTPLFFGYASVTAYTPEHDVTITVANTYNEGAFDEEGNYANGNGSMPIFRSIAEYLIPGQDTSIPAR